MRALITGAAGQDGTILASLLARDGVDVVGLVRPGTPTDLLRRYVPSIVVLDVDLADHPRVREAVLDVEPDEIYNLGGFTAPGESWDRPDEVHAVNVGGVEAILEAMRQRAGRAGRSRLFQAASAHVFEGTDRSPQDESFELTPVSPYARSKAEALQLVRAARKEEGLFATCGIMYNHESPLRPPNFVTRRITEAVARIHRGLQDTLELGDIEVARDWGWAPDYVRAMRLMLAAPQPGDFVLATGISHRLSFFITKAFAQVGIDDWRPFVTSTQERKRLADTNKMVGDPRAAYRDLGWRHTVDFDAIAARMVEHDLELLDDPDSLWTGF